MDFSAAQGDTEEEVREVEASASGVEVREAVVAVVSQDPSNSDL